MNVKKRLCVMILAVSFVIASVIPSANAFAVEYLDSTIVWGQRYSGIVTPNGYDVYKIAVPATMKVNIRNVNFKVATSGGYNGGFDCEIYDDSYTIVKNYRISSASVQSVMLTEGTYFIHFINHTGHYDVDYTFEFYYDIETPKVDLYSVNSGSLNVRANKGEDSIHGYEVRYRLSGKSWVKRNFEEIGDLNETIKGLKAGKYYAVQVRKYVENEEGKLFYSKWSAIKKIKIKK